MKFTAIQNLAAEFAARFFFCLRSIFNLTSFNQLIFNLSFSFCFIYFFILIHVFFRSFLSIFSVYPMPGIIAAGDFLRIYLLYIKCKIFRSEKRLAQSASHQPYSLRFCCYTIFLLLRYTPLRSR